MEASQQLEETTSHLPATSTQQSLKHRSSSAHHLLKPPTSAALDKYLLHLHKPVLTGTMLSPECTVPLEAQGRGRSQAGKLGDGRLASLRSKDRGWLEEHCRPLFTATN